MYNDAPERHEAAAVSAVLLHDWHFPREYINDLGNQKL
jgi:hypothetical protein